MKNCIGIRQENKDLTERRAPLTPTHVKKLVDEHQLKVIVEPAENRVFPEQDYETAGATISSDLSESNLILGVKEIPLGKFLPQMAYCFFSHTIKGQDYNMPMLAKMLELNTTLLDYELVKDDKGRRTVFFGNFAGYAGMIDSLWALGRRLAWEGIDTPFKDVLPASQYHGLLAAEQAIGEIGKDIEKQGLPSRVTPFVTGFTGYGQVSKGAQHIFDLLPVERISPSELISFFEEGQFSAHKVYKVEFYEKDMFKPKDDRKSFDLPEYFKYPDRYQRNFDQYIPYLTMMINGIYWEPRCPRLVRKSFMKELYQKEDQPRLRVIGDITCDIDGSVELTVKSTNSQNPVYVFDPLTEKVSDGWEGRGPVMMAVDKLPAELPREASAFFGDALLPYIPNLASADYSVHYEKLNISPKFKRAAIVHRGKLTPAFEYLANYLK